MNRVEIKKKAKELINGNKWYLWKPLILASLVSSVISSLAYTFDSALGLAKKETIDFFGTPMTYTSTGIVSSMASFIIGIVGAAFAVAYAYYVLSFVRGKKLELNDIIDFMKKNWIISFVTSFLAGLIVMGCSLLLIIPGIIAGIGLYFYKETCVDNLELKATEIIKKTWEMTKGHKMELFVLGLSFIGWCILAGFTLGILFIWLIPYMTVTLTLAYEELKK